MAQTLKNLPAMQETWVPSLGQEDPAESGEEYLTSGKEYIETLKTLIGS